MQRSWCYGTSYDRNDDFMSWNQMIWSEFYKIMLFNLVSLLFDSDAWLNSILWQIYFQSNLNLFSAGSSVQTLIQGRINCWGMTLKLIWVSFSGIFTMPCNVISHQKCQFNSRIFSTKHNALMHRLVQIYLCVTQSAVDVRIWARGADFNRKAWKNTQKSTRHAHPTSLYRVLIVLQKSA